MVICVPHYLALQVALKTNSLRSHTGNNENNVFNISMRREKKAL